jgi:hypothetical protein
MCGRSLQVGLPLHWIHFCQFNDGYGATSRPSTHCQYREFEKRLSCGSLQVGCVADSQHLYAVTGDNMLQLRPSCECCDRALPPLSTDARICSFECTFCASCAESVLQSKCPNCGGELVVRPRRPANKLPANPASTERVYSPAGCANFA